MKIKFGLLETYKNTILGNRRDFLELYDTCKTNNEKAIISNGECYIVDDQPSVINTDRLPCKIYVEKVI